MNLAHDFTYSDMQNSPMSENNARAIIAKWLKDAIKDNDMTQAELGRQINLDQSKINRIISEERSMSAEEMIAAATALKTEIPSLSGDTAPQIASANAATVHAIQTQELLEGWHPQQFEIALAMGERVKSEWDGEMPDDVFLDVVARTYRTLIAIRAKEQSTKDVIQD